MIYKRTRNIIYLLIFIVFLSGSLYWMKKRLNIDIFESFSLSHTFPFKYIPKYVIKNPRAGDLILKDDFESKFRPRTLWGALWMREDGKVVRSVDSPENHSRCLLITSESSRDWSYECQFLIRADAGDVFYYEGLAGLQGAEAHAVLGFTTFDPEKTVLAWNYGVSPVEPGPMALIRRQVSIGEGVGFIRFRIAGRGRGQFRFDNIRLIKIRSGKPN